MVEDYVLRLFEYGLAGVALYLLYIIASTRLTEISQKLDFLASELRKTNPHEKLDEVSRRLDELSRRLSNLSTEISELIAEMRREHELIGGLLEELRRRRRRRDSTQQEPGTSG